MREVFIAYTVVVTQYPNAPFFGNATVRLNNNERVNGELIRSFEEELRNIVSEKHKLKVDNIVVTIISISYL